MTISCSVQDPKHWYPDDPDHNDLRVSNNFSLKKLKPFIKITTSIPCQFRIREDHSGSTDYPAYNGQYFRNGDYIPRSDYDNLYISDPCYVTAPDEIRKPMPKDTEFSVTFESAADESKARFLVSSDFHLCAADDDSPDERSRSMQDDIDLDKLIYRVSTLGPLNFYAVCGDLTDDSNGGQEDKFEHRFLDRIDQETAIKCVCEGWGNHDVRRKHFNCTNVQDGIAYRNRKGRYRDNHLTALVTSDNDYHYHWHYNLSNADNTKSITLHFFMLNNVPGYGEIKNDPACARKDDEYTAQDERNPYCSLEFLEKELKSFGPDDYYILFFHINFNSKITAADTNGEQWWTKQSMKDFCNVIRKGKGTYLYSFFGHNHNNPGFEKLVDADLTLQGYRCACNDGRGATYYTLVEIPLNADDKPEVSIQTYTTDGKEVTNVPEVTVQL